MTVYDTQVTDEFGVAELNSPAQNSTGTKAFIVKHGNVNYPTSVQVVEVGTIFFIPSNSEYAYNGGDIELVATVTDINVEPISGIKITINGVTTITDSEGKAWGVYVGTGTAGRVELTASCGSESSTITIEDVMQYWSQLEDRKYNVDYSTQGQINVQELMKGIKLTTPILGYELGGSRAEGRINFRNPYRTSHSWEFSFVVRSFLKNETTINVASATITSRLQTNSVVKVTFNKNTGVRKVFVDEVEVSSSSNLSLASSDISMSGEMMIDNVKLMRV